MPTDAGSPEARGPGPGAGEPPSPTPGKARLRDTLGCLALLVVWGALSVFWARELHPFVREWGSLLALSAFGPPLLILAALFLGRAALSILKPPALFGYLFLVVVLSGAAGLTLSTAAPAGWLESTPFGSGMLKGRARLLGDAIDEGDVARAGVIARRGLLDPAPRGSFDRPLLHDAETEEMVRVLLSAGLDPDPRDDEGRTLLMLTWDPAITAALIEAGADLEVRDALGRTTLMYAPAKGEEIVRLLLDAGADPTTIDDTGTSILEVFQRDPELEMVLKEATSGIDLDAVPRPEGKRDWLVLVGDAGGVRPESELVLDPPYPGWGGEGRLNLHLTNPSTEDRQVLVSAVLNQALLFVEASHGGAITLPEEAKIDREVRWPVLDLPAASEGRLWIRFVARWDYSAGDLGIDVTVRDVDARAEPETLVLAQSLEAPSEEGVDLSPASLVFPLASIGFLALIIVFLWWATRTRPEGGDRRYVVAYAVSGVCFLIAISMIWWTIEPNWTWEEAECEVLDHRLEIRVSSSSSSSGRSSTTIHHLPLVAARYVAGDAGEMVSSGFAAPFAAGSEEDLKSFPIGETAPCFYDPDHPATFALVRGPTMGPFVAIGLLLLSSAVFGFVGRFFS